MSRKTLGQGEKMSNEEFDRLERLVRGEDYTERRKRTEWWNIFLDDTYTRGLGEPYRHTHVRIMSSALRSGGRESLICHKYRVTDFTDWVFRLYGTSEPHALDKGTNVAIAVAKQKERERRRRRVAVYLASLEESNWCLDYQDPLDCPPEPLLISALQINGLPLWGSPDLVFRNRNTGQILIIENKASDRGMPSDGWPNARAQLWAYSKIDRYADSPQVTMLLNAWSSQLSLVGLARWTREDPVLNLQNQELFEVFRKSCESVTNVSPF